MFPTSRQCAHHLSTGWFLLFPPDAGVPYQFDYTVTQTNWPECQLLTVLQGLAEKYANYPSRVELQHHFKSLDNVTCLDKVRPVPEAVTAVMMPQPVVHHSHFCHAS